METIAAILAVVAAIATIATYLHQYGVEPEENRQYRIQTFQNARQVNAELLEMLISYVSEYAAANDHFMQGISFQETIDILRKAESQLLNDENLKVLQKGKGNSRGLENITKGLENHIRHVTETKNVFLYHPEFKAQRGIT